MKFIRHIFILGSFNLIWKKKSIDWRDLYHYQKKYAIENTHINGITNEIWGRQKNIEKNRAGATDDDFVVL